MLNPNATETILLIDDDGDIAELVRESLAEPNKQIVHVSTGRAACEWLAHHHPTLILMDYSMSDMSGIELVERLATRANGNPPFIVTTGSGDKQFAVAMMKRGARDYVVKDLNFLDRLPLVVAQVQKQIATERQLAETKQALQESQHKYRQLFESIGEAIIVYNDQGKLLDCNPVALTMYGYTREEFLELGGADLIHPDYLSQMQTHLPELMANRVAFAESLHHRKDGSSFPVEVSVRRINYHDGDAFLTAVRDISEHKRTEEKLEQLASIVQSSDDAIISATLNRTISSWNKGAEKLYGYSADEMIDKPVSILIPPHISDKALQIREQVRHGKVQEHFETERLRKDGTIVQVSMTMSPILNASGAIVGISSIARDITERKRAEEEAAQKNKQLTMLNHLGQALNKLAAPSEILERISDLIGQLFDNRNLYIALYDESTNFVSFPVYTVAGDRKRSVEGRPLSNGLTECVIRARAPVLIPNHVDTWLAERGVALIGTPCYCYLGVPILIEEHVIGVIAVQDYERANVYNHSHIELLSTIASQAAIALANARLYETVQKELADRKIAEEQLRYLNTHDILTSLYNRAFFEAELARLEPSREYPLSFAVADVDNMKITNDTQGHAAGDELLKRAAQVLKSAFRKSDIIARIGGDEFAIIWPLTDLATAEQLLARIKRNLFKFNLDHPDLAFQLSLGIATTTNGNLAETLRLADARMYEDKRTHKSST
jgi:diguanylate cyclase (GGDEF)-like protein/PAS domain S-box-containing protein